MGETQALAVNQLLKMKPSSWQSHLLGGSEEHRALFFQRTRV